MAITEKSTYIKRELEYTSPDDDKWAIVYIEHAGRKYVQLGKADEPVEQRVIFDLDMLFDINDQLRDTLYRSQNKAANLRVMTPSVVDHRSGKIPAYDRIQLQVDATMQNRDESVNPVESFSMPVTENEWQAHATGIRTEDLGEVGETPEDFREEKTQLQEEISERLQKVATNDTAKIKRINPGDFI